MPLYTFESESGEVVEKLVPTGTDALLIEGVKFSRTSSPQSFAYTGNAVGMLSQKEQVKDGYYKLECSQGSRFKSSYSKETIKKTWGI
tara:strand:+ start:1946 stop:2209 length:264 start_codon:yes stop_codon:yes gene_type:complete